MQVKCTSCGHEWDEGRFFIRRKCPSCRDMLDIPQCQRHWRMTHGVVPTGPPAPPPPPQADPGDPGKLPPPAKLRPLIGDTKPSDHSYLDHNPWKEVADAAKRKRISLWPDYGDSVGRAKPVKH